MFSKLSNKTLLIVLVVLGVAFYFAVFSDHSNSSYKNELVNIDTAQITKIKFDVPEKGAFELIKNNNDWNLKYGSHVADADLNKIKAFLSQMAPLKTIRVASNSEKDWKKYGVDDQALKIDFLKGDKSLGTIYLGKIHYETPPEEERNPYQRGTQGRLVGYARAKGDNMIYVVDGYMKISYGGGADSFKNKVLVDVDPKSIKGVDFKSGDTSFNLTKTSQGWMINNQPADSAVSAKYIRAISRLSGYDFVEKDSIKGISPVATVTVKTGDAGLIKVEAFPVDSVNFALVSSVNKGNVIKDKNHRLFDRLFKEKDYFKVKEKK